MIRVLMAASFLIASAIAIRAAEFPRVVVENVRRVYHDGNHNAFTDLIQFRNRYLLTFRSCPDGHMVHPTASIVVLASFDLKDWHEVHRFSVAERDTRDPHFLVFKDRLFVYTGTWYSGKQTIPTSEYDLNKHLGYAVHTDDGESWTDPIMLEGTYGHYIWRAASWGDKAYLCGRRKIEFSTAPRGEPDTVESVMLESDDGLIWRKRAFFQTTQGDETAFQFYGDGELLAIGRRGRAPAQLIRSKMPLNEWNRVDLDEYIGGPLLTRWGDHWLVGGRKNTDQGPVTALHWLDGDRLVPCVELPSAGDNSYPGFIELAPGYAVVSWYSTHETNEQGQPITAIYMADLVQE